MSVVKGSKMSRFLLYLDAFVPQIVYLLLFLRTTYFGSECCPERDNIRICQLACLRVKLAKALCPKLPVPKS